LGEQNQPEVVINKGLGSVADRFTGGAFMAQTCTHLKLIGNRQLVQASRDVSSNNICQQPSTVDSAQASKHRCKAHELTSGNYNVAAAEITCASLAFAAAAASLTSHVEETTKGKISCPRARAREVAASKQFFDCNQQNKTKVYRSGLGRKDRRPFLSYNEDFSGRHIALKFTYLATLL